MLVRVNKHPKNCRKILRADQAMLYSAEDQQGDYDGQCDKKSPAVRGKSPEEVKLSLRFR
jgi:hypothetical protein